MAIAICGENVEKSSGMKTFEADFNAGKLTESLRYTGYDNVSAIADLIDNSIDANATNINLDICTEDKEIKIYLMDNGEGMAENVLREALKVGSDVPKIRSEHLGFFGMGLCTASWSMARCFDIYTKTKGENFIHHARVDLDKIAKENKYVFDYEQLNNSDVFEEQYSLVGGGKKKSFIDVSGTLLLLSKVDRPDTSNTTNLGNKIKKHAQRIFRMFLNSKVSMVINGNKCEPFDPLFWEDETTEQWSNETKTFIVNGRQIDLDIKMVRISKDKYGQKAKTANGIDKIGIKNQGFYILRNNREIANEISLLENYKKHPSTNNFRCEISFSGDIDDCFYMNFRKKDFALEQSLNDQLEAYIVPNVTQIIKKNQSENKTKASSNDIEKLDELSKNIVKKKNLLILPSSKKETRNSPQNKSGTKKSKEKGSPRKPNKVKTVISDLVEWRHEKGGEKSNLYYAEQKGSTIIITLNADHPLYNITFGKSKISKNNEAHNVFAYLIYSLASAELYYVGDSEDYEERLEIIDNIKTVMSSNLANLLK